MLLLFSVLLATILIGSAYIITEKNARYYLSGYWNLKPADREKVDLKGYLRHWKKCMWIAGVLIIFTGAILNFTTESPWDILALLAMVLVSFPVLIITGRKYWKKDSANTYTPAGGVCAETLTLNHKKGEKVGS